jgi:hypothetical protein
MRLSSQSPINFKSLELITELSCLTPDASDAGGGEGSTLLNEATSEDILYTSISKNKTTFKSL